MKILIPAATPVRPALDDVEYVEYSGLEIPQEHRDAEVLVIWGGSVEKIKELLDSLPNLKFVQSLAAGPDALLAAGLPEGVRVATGIGLHDRTVSEHAISLILRLVTKMDEAVLAQKEGRWAGNLAVPRELQPTDRVASIVDARCLVWGFGSIGSALAKRLDAMGAKSVRGVARSARERDGYEVFTEDSLPELLPETDILVMVLPRTDATMNVLNAERIAMLPKRAIVVNVGRGTTIDEDALVAALKAGELAGAGLDVMQVEPLPADSPLWDAPNTALTPHMAGFRPDGGEELLAYNVGVLRDGGRLRNEVDL